MNYHKEFLKIVKCYDVDCVFDCKSLKDCYAEHFYSTDESDIKMNTRICLIPITNITHFAVALHELAHAVGESNKFLCKSHYKTMREDTTKFILKREFNAWKLAKEISPIWNKTMNNVFLRGIKTYIKDWEQCWNSKLPVNLYNKLTDLNSMYFNI
jgi:hypothetical protein